MQKPAQHIGVIAKNAQHVRSRSEEKKVAAILSRLLDSLLTAQVCISADESLADYDLPKDITVVRRNQLADCDMVFVLGGDGTLLDAARQLAPYKTALLGINLGRLGFLVDVSPEQMQQAVSDVLAGNCISESRMMLEATLTHANGQQETHAAVNDVVIHSKDVVRMLEMDTHIDGHLLNQTRADGLIIATPTGSTAYALSGGGPVVHPNMQAISLVPICPHTLAGRPVVAPASAEISAQITNETAGMVSWDGQIAHEFCRGDKITVKAAEHPVTLLHLDGYDFFEILRRKLHWSRQGQ